MGEWRCEVCPSTATRASHVIAHAMPAHHFRRSPLKLRTNKHTVWDLFRSKWQEQNYCLETGLGRKAAASPAECSHEARRAAHPCCLKRDQADTGKGVAQGQRKGRHWTVSSVLRVKRKG